jgi:putative ABC transport system permease protein
MNIFRLITNSLKHYRASNLATTAGVAITTAVICGALIIGDSINKSLFQILDYRLGNTTHTITAGERVFTQDIAQKLNLQKDINANAILNTNGIITEQESGQRINNVQIWGVNNHFGFFFESDTSKYEILPGEAFINENLAQKLKLDSGDYFLVRFKNTGAIPSNTPFVAEGSQTISRRIKITGIIDNELGANFSLLASQIIPDNIFVNIDWLNRVLDLENNANIILVELKNPDDSNNLTNQLKMALSLKDINLELKICKNTNDFLLTSDRVFIDTYINEQINIHLPESEFYLSYFINSFKSNNKSTPYSFISAVDSSRFVLDDNEIIINQWLADDLQISIGDSIWINYYQIGVLRELQEKNQVFVVSGIISMDESVNDKNLMPFIPGLSDAGNCRDWDAGVPIDLQSIRQKDEEYWETYKGTPKAYISLTTGQNIWANRFGNISTIIIPSTFYSTTEISNIITRNINPSNLEFRINETRKYGELAATNGEDFSSLFAGLGMFIIFSALLLTVLLLNLSLKNRESQIELYGSLGFSKKIIRKIILGEFFAITVAGGIFGVIISIFYSKLIMIGLNQVWYDIVRTNILSLHYSYSSLIFGGLSGISLSLIAAIFGINKNIFKKDNHNKNKKRGFLISKQILRYVAILLLFLSIAAFAYLFTYVQFDKIFLWLITGIVFFIALLGIIANHLYSDITPSVSHLSVIRLSTGNLSRNPGRSLSIIVLLAIGSFIVITTAANRKNISLDYSDHTGGTGGFDYFAETSVPFLRNLNNPDTKSELSLPDNLNFIQFFSVYNDDASCLNLNEVANPRILAVNPENLANRFSFVSVHKDLGSKNPWLGLNENINGVIPAIADQTVIRWGLGKSVGDTLFYQNSAGEEIRLLLIGGLANSVFQGNVIISEHNFKTHFPSLSGTNVFLIETDSDKADEIEEELNFIFRDYGWEMIPANFKLAEFNSVENTYLQIFFLLGALGILLGTIGLSVILAKSLIERKSEIALFSSLGFSYPKIGRIYLIEYSILLVCGIFIGVISAIISGFPAFYLSPMSSIISIIGVNLVIIINGLLWILLITIFILRKLSIPVSLRND